MSTQRLAKLMSDIARERTRLRPVPRRGVGRFIADADQVAEEPAMGAPPDLIINVRVPPAPPSVGSRQWQQVEAECVKDFPEAETEMETTIGGTNPGGGGFMKPGQPTN